MPIERYIIIDTETNGLVIKEDRNRYPQPWQTECYPYLASVSWIVIENDRIVDKHHYLIQPLNDYEENEEATAIHGLDKRQLMRYGVSFDFVMEKLYNSLINVDKIMGYNLMFDFFVIQGGLYKYNLNKPFIDMVKEEMWKKERVCVMKMVSYGRWRKLTDIYEECFNEIFNAHNSLEDCIATYKVYNYYTRELTIDIESDNEYEMSD